MKTKTIIVNKKEQFILERAFTDYGRILENVIFILNDWIENPKSTPFSETILIENKEKLFDEYYKRNCLVKSVCELHELKDYTGVKYDFDEGKLTLYNYPNQCKKV